MVGFVLILVLTGSVCTIFAGPSQLIEQSNTVTTIEAITAVAWLLYFGFAFSACLVMIRNSNIRGLHLIALFLLIGYMYVRSLIPGGYTTRLVWYNIYLYLVLPGILTLDMHDNAESTTE